MFSFEYSNLILVSIPKIFQSSERNIPMFLKWDSEFWILERNEMKNAITAFE